MTLNLSVNSTVAGLSKVNSSRFFYFLSFVEYFQNLLRNFSKIFLHSIDKEENQIKKDLKSDNMYLNGPMSTKIDLSIIKFFKEREFDDLKANCFV